MLFFCCFLLLFSPFFSEYNRIPSGKKTDWNAGGNYITSAKYRVQVEGHFVLHIIDGVCVAVTTLAQSSSLPKSARVEWC